MSTIPHAEQAGAQAWMDVIWQDVKARLRHISHSEATTRVIDAQEFSLWVEHSRPVRIMPGAPGLYLLARDEFLSLRFPDHPQLISIVDYALLETYGRAGMGPAPVLRGIRAMFEQQKQRGGTINSIAYCHHAIIAEAESMKEAAVGTRQPSSVKSGFAPATILIAVPRNGAAIYKARTRENLLNTLTHKVNSALTAVITPQPDDSQREELKRRFGWELPV